MTTTRSLPGIATAARRGPSATARLVAGLHKSRMVLRGVPTFSLLVLAVTVICALLAPVLAPYDPIKTNPAQALSAPSLSGHLLGTDHLGRDILSRLIYGARISVTVGFLRSLWRGPSARPLP